MTRVSFFSSDYTITGFGWAEVRSCPRLTQGAAAGHHIIYYYYTHTFLTWVEILFSIGSYLGDFFGFHFLPTLLLLLLSKRAAAIRNFLLKNLTKLLYIIFADLHKIWRDHCHYIAEADWIFAAHLQDPGSKNKQQQKEQHYHIGRPPSPTCCCCCY